MMIILEMLVTALSDQPQAILLRRRPSSLNTRSNQDIIVGAMTPVLSHISIWVLNLQCFDAYLKFINRLLRTI